MRAFFAIPMPDEQRDALARAQGRLAGIGNVAWTRQHAFHLTLAFLGDVDERGIDAALLALDRIPRLRTAARLVGLGGFPSLFAARVLWLGVHGADDELGQLAASLRLADSTVGEPFVPHVTIGRARAGSVVDLRAAAPRIGDLGAPAFLLSPIVLYESVRGAEGGRYVELARKE